MLSARLVVKAGLVVWVTDSDAGTGLSGPVDGVWKGSVGPHPVKINTKTAKNPTVCRMLVLFIVCYSPVRLMNGSATAGTVYFEDFPSHSLRIGSTTLNDTVGEFSGPPAARVHLTKDCRSRVSGNPNAILDARFRGHDGHCLESEAKTFEHRPFEASIPSNLTLRG